MTVLVIGSGGREHAIILKLAASKYKPELHCAPGNGGIGRYAKLHNVKATDIDGMVALAKELSPDWVFVAADDPLVLGMVDAMEANGFRCFGPRKNAAIIEGSKAFSKAFMRRNGIPTASYEIFETSETAIDYIKSQGKYPTVIKADGLALGKGAIIAQDFEQAKAAVLSIMEDKVFGESGARVVIEEHMTGVEATVLAFSDGKTVKPMISSMDHKRVNDNDQGPNTGGMGAVAPSPFLSNDLAKLGMERIFRPTIECMAKEGRTFKGCIYFELMLTDEGPKIIEYNCRFGDPEAQVVLPLLKTDLIDIMAAIDEERLADIDIEWSSDSAACVIMASGGYPVSYKTGFIINGLDDMGQINDATVYHAGTGFNGKEFTTAGGRVLGITCTGKDLDTALSLAYNAVSQIDFNGAHYRKDIGSKRP